MSTLYFGDNLEVLRSHIKDESVDLVYLDPPFNSKADYNILYQEPTGKPSAAQIVAFEDSWHWTDEASSAFQEIIENAPATVVEMMRSFRQFIGHNDMMAYLTMMCIRLIELRRVLKPEGSIYLHCDPTASHYLKVLMDSIFGSKNFRNEIVWHYSGWNKKLGDHFEKRSDTILFYAKSSKQIFNSYAVPWKSVEEYVKVRKQKVLKDASGRPYVLSDAGGGKRVQRYLDEAMKYGHPIDNVWDIDKLNNSSKEKLGYPTQKPEALLERIIRASSDEGGVVLDPFSGCGTTTVVAHALRRQWIGIDITHLAINLIKWRMNKAFDIHPDKDYQVVGEPKDVSGAVELASQDRYQFQWWALSLFGARPFGDKKKGSDKGIDGYLYFSETIDEVGSAIVSVKSGKVSVKDIRDLGHVIDRENAKIGILVTLNEPTRDMKTEAAGSGHYLSPLTGKNHAKIQILTIEQLLAGTMPDTPPKLSAFKKAEIAKPINPSLF